MQVPGEQRDEVCWGQAHSGAAALPGLRDRNTGHETQTQLWRPRWVQRTEEGTGEQPQQYGGSSTVSAEMGAQRWSEIQDGAEQTAQG